MKTTLLKATAVATIISAPLLIIGCGGGSTSATSTAPMAKITGTVPGTLIEAFCANGTHVTVTSTQNGTAQHPFEISVPQNTECRLVMTTNENDPVNRVVTNIGFATATATGLTLSLNQDLSLGYIPLAMDPNAVPTVNNMVVDPLIVPIAPATPAMDPNMPAPTMDANMTAPATPAIDPTMVNVSASAAPISAFDANGNGIIDAYEDMNNNGVMDAFDPEYTAPAGTTNTTYTDDDKGSSDDSYTDDDKGSSDDYTTTTGTTTGTTTYIDNDDDNDDDKGSSDNDDYDNDDDNDDDKGSSDNDNDDDKGSND